MKNSPFSSKKRQLSYLSKKYFKLSSENNIHNQTKLNNLLLKIKELFIELKQIFNLWELKKIMGAAALLIGIGTSNESFGQQFAKAQKNPFFLSSNGGDIAYPAVADLDGDGDLDILAGGMDGALFYYKNTGTKSVAKYDAPELNPFGLDSAYYIALSTFADLDNDGDYDLLVGEYEGNLRYFENTGTKTSPQFASPVINPFGLKPTKYFAAPAFADLDGDGDFDLLVLEAYSTTIYFENTGSKSNPQFAVPRKNIGGLTIQLYTAFPAFADLDKDGDFDLMVGDDYGALHYYKNTGTKTNPQFSKGIVNPFGLDSTQYYSAPCFGDFDDDGDLDLLVGEEYGNFSYFQNVTPHASAILAKELQIEIHPNPTSDFITIKNIDAVKLVQILNLQGQLITSYEDPIGNISLKGVAAGIYLIQVFDKEGNFGTEKLIKE